MYDLGEGVEQDLKKAVELFQQSANSNNVNGIYNLALAYENGRGVNQDKKKTIELYQQAIELNDTESMYNLAMTYEKGDTGELEKSAELYQRAVDLGHVRSMNNLAIMYSNYGVLEEDKIKAIELFTQAIELGNVSSLYNLALLYNANDTNEDNKKATELFIQAAGLGNVDAMFTLAMMYKNGNGVNKDPEQAASLFAEASDRGHQKANLYTPHKLIMGLFNQHKEFETLRANLLELEDVIRAIKELHIYNCQEPLAHFTSWPAIESILPKEIKNTQHNKLRLYNVDYMNDPTEGRSLINLANEHSEETNSFLNVIIGKILLLNDSGTIDSVPPSIYSLSFTESSDRLDLWRAYGNDGDGFSIVTTFSNQEKEVALNRNTLDIFEIHDKQAINFSQNVSSTTETKDLVSPPILFRVFYKDEEKLSTIKKLNIPLDKIKDKLSELTEFNHDHVYYVLYATLLEIMYLYKDEQYSTEREVRAIQAVPLDKVQLDERNPGRLYCETAPFLFKNIASKVVIGPKVQEQQVALWNLRYRLKKNGFGNTTNVEFSKVKYR